MKTKLCPDFAHPCIKEACMAYIPKTICPIENVQVIECLFPELNIDLKSIQYPFFLDIEAGFCKKYSDRTDDNNSDLISELNKITMELYLNDLH